jgi:hypothetical protein
MIIVIIFNYITLNFCVCGSRVYCFYFYLACLCFVEGAVPHMSVVTNGRPLAPLLNASVVESNDLSDDSGTVDVSGGKFPFIHLSKTSLYHFSDSFFLDCRIFVGRINLLCRRELNSIAYFAGHALYWSKQCAPNRIGAVAGCGDRFTRCDM